MPDKLTFQPDFELDCFTEVRGFDDLYATWSDILTPDGSGEYVDPAEAIEMWRSAELAVIEATGLRGDLVTKISGVACSYARKLPHRLEEEIRTDEQ